MQINGKRIIITGAGSGIGRALLENLCSVPNTKIFASDVDIHSLTAIENKVWVHQADMSIAKDIDQLLDTARSTLGEIDLIFANAGFAYHGDLGKPDWIKLQQIFATNTFAPLYILQHMLTRNPEEQFRVIATASAMAYLPLPRYAIYSATKAALHQFAQSVRFELKRPTTFTIVYPIATRTKFFQHTNHTAPIPWPSQAPSHVAKAILAGVQANQADIYPSWIFRCMLVANRVFPIIGKLYQMKYR